MIEVTFLDQDKEAEFIERIDFTPISPEDIEFVFKNSLSTTDEYSTCFVSTCGRFFKETITKRDAFGSLKGKPKHYFFLRDEVEEARRYDDFKVNEFKDLVSIVEAYNAKRKFESENLIKKGYRVILKPTVVLI